MRTSNGCCPFSREEPLRRLATLLAAGPLATFEYLHHFQPFYGAYTLELCVWLESFLGVGAPRLSRQEHHFGRWVFLRAPEALVVTLAAALIGPASVCVGLAKPARKQSVH